MGISGHAKRTLFYSHDTLGLGHLRRTLFICSGLLSQFTDLTTLVITGSAMAHGFRMPPGVDYIKLPSVTKLDNESYASRSLSLPFETVLRLRQELILRTAIEYRPDFLFVDNVPLGMKGELREALRYIRENLPATRVLLTLRDILDDRSHIVPLWRKQGVFDALEQFYDRIFIYGLPEVFDPVTEYDWPEAVRQKSCFCGYIPRVVDSDAIHTARNEICDEGEKLVLVTVGGGSDGSRLVDAYLHALPLMHGSDSIRSLVLLGPEMDAGQAAQFRARFAGNPRVQFMDFCADPLAYMGAADAVISMAGYNTITEILALRKRAVVVPRVRPRVEQLIRARRLQELGCLRMIHPDSLTPRLLAMYVSEAINGGDALPAPLAFCGIDRLGSELRALMSERPVHRPRLVAS